MSPLKNTILVFLLALVCFAFLPKVQAGLIGSPPPDGCYPNFTTAEGCNALHSLTTGEANTGVGWRSLFTNTIGSFNTGIGAGALVLNTGDSNTAVGAAALLLNTTGTDNTATGTGALLNNTTGGDNVAIGNVALTANMTGDDNTGVGNFALAGNTTGGNNTATGNFALAANTNGNGNVAVGNGAGDAIVNGSNNVTIGQMAGTTFVHGNNMIAIGAPGAGPFADTSSSVFIGSVFSEMISDPATAQPVFVDQFNNVATVVSSRRFKHDIQPMDKASEAILALKPVRFHYTYDKKNTPEFGLIAEDVAGVNPALVVRDKEGQPQSVRYDQVNAMLLNEFLKEHCTVQELKSNAAKQEAIITLQQKQIDALTAVVQKVSAQLEVSKAAPQTVLNNH